MSTQVAVVGRLTADPELKFTPGGKAVASFSVADNHRKRSASGDWEDDGATFYSCEAWEQQAENVAETLRKGHEVVVVGDLRNREWTSRDGQKSGRTLEIRVRAVGPSLRYLQGAMRDGAGRQGGGGQGAGWGQPTGGQRQGSVDPWAAAGTEEAPF